MHPPLILVADNDPDVSLLLADVLRMHGARTEVVPDGDAAVQRLMQGDVHLLVCDLDMPKLDGEGVVRALPRCPSPPPVLVVSGFVDDATLGRLQESPHVRGVLRKPFDVIEFAQRACATAAAHAGAGDSAAGPRRGERFGDDG
ncbi:MAG: response regulator [Planctomycetota bacterium]